MAANIPSTGNNLVIGADDNARVENLTVTGTIPNSQGQNITITGAAGHSNVENLAVTVNIITGKGDVDEIQKQTLDAVQYWTQGTVEPTVLSEVLEKIRPGSACLTITGSPGEGKSTLGYWVLKHLQQTRNVFKVSSPKQFAEVIKTCAPVILLDDIFGQTVFNDSAWKEWKEIIEKFIDMKTKRPIDETGNLILISRDFVLKSGSRRTENPWKMLINNDYVVNISTDVRGNAEKVTILESIAKMYNTHLDSDTIRTICSIQTPHGFPHACKLFVTLHKSKIPAETFFNNPLEFLHESLKILMRDEKDIEYIFTEMIKGDGHVLKDELGENGYKYITTANDLSTYIKPDRDGYVFDHPSIMDTVALLLCETKLPFILERCSMEFIKERVWLETTDGEKRSETGAGAKLMAKIPWNEAEELATRFVDEIAAGNLSDVVYHNAWHSDRFVMLMLKSLTADQVNVQDGSLGLYGGDTLLHQLCGENRADCVKMCVQRGADVNSQSELGWTPLHRTALRGSTESARVLLELGVNVNITDNRGRTALDLATEYGQSETAAVLRAAGGRISTRR